MSGKRSTRVGSLQEASGSASKRVKRTPPATELLREFSLANVLTKAKSAAVTHAHLPEAVATKLFDQDATISYLTTDHASWVFHVPRWYQHVFKHAKPEELHAAFAAEDASKAAATASQPSATWSTLFEQAWEAHPEQFNSIMMFGKPTKLQRFQLLCGDAASYRYSGSTFIAQRTYPSALNHVARHMQRLVEDPATDRTRFSGGLVNWYADGNHYIGAHADDERDLMKGSPIAGLSLGATRRFVLTRKTPKSAPAGDEAAVKRLELQLGDGDLIVMGGTTQQTHKHALPKMARCHDRRLSITMRCFK
ncbi:hypothetical protein BBJ28_00009852 [Nothophytophthora sp. Chile5]|nr:hypothetical protein BBJ28_00009852 [Nothophytophthora sp. Chile5]